MSCYSYYIAQFYSVCLLYFHVFFFFKQKTAYEMRISDWSSDVCSSDLRTAWARAVSIFAASAGVTGMVGTCGTCGVGRVFSGTASGGTMTSDSGSRDRKSVV